MSKIKIGYWPLTQTLKSAGDRRRLVFWAKARGHTLITDLSNKVDVIVASENADFNSSVFSDGSTPVVFDLVDAYLSPLNPLEDLARGIAKKLTGQITGEVKPFSHHVRDFCQTASTVICSSMEQELLINSYNRRTRVILDSHDEFLFNEATNYSASAMPKRRILWEGQPATIKGINSITSVLTKISENEGLYLDVVTDMRYFRLLNRFFERDTFQLIDKNLYKVPGMVNLIPWTPENLQKFAKECAVAMIPIDLSVPMQALKPENRLLIMWRLGLPCLTSASPAYSRVAEIAGVSAVCKSLEEWSVNFSRILNDSTFARSEIRKGQEYLRSYHNRDDLLRKWDLVFESVM